MRFGRDSRRRWRRCERAARAIDETGIQHAAAIAPIYMHITFGDAAAYHAKTLESMPERYTPAVRSRLEVARYVLAEDYVRALSGREMLRREVVAALAGYDALVLPTLPIPAPRDRRELGPDRIRQRTGPRAHAARDTTLQPHRASGDLAAVRDARRQASRAASSWWANWPRLTRSCGSLSPSNECSILRVGIRP